MKLLLISNGNLEYDGRLRRLISVFSQVGELYTFTRGHDPLTEHGKICNASYISFIIGAINYARVLDNIDVLIVDNSKATIPGLLLKILKHPGYIIQDCRELNQINEAKSIKSKILCFFETFMIEKTDILICANDRRAEIMKKAYSLKIQPLVYGNIRQLDYATMESRYLAEQEFKPYLKDNELRIITLAGCSLIRTTDVLVKNLKNIRPKCRLFIAGSNVPEEEDIIEKLAALDTRNKVTIVGLLTYSELKYLVSQCHIGIVCYGQHNANNKYCASGKLYEYLYEGIPVVTTSNPPLKQICEKYKIGVADDTFADGVNEVFENYEFYKGRVKAYTEKVTIADNDSKLIREIEELLHAK